MLAKIQRSTWLYINRGSIAAARLLATWVKKEAMVAYFKMRDAGLWFDRGINTVYSKIAQLTEKEIPTGCIESTLSQSHQIDNGREEM